MTTLPPGSFDDGYDDLVSSALLGTARRGPGPAGLPPDVLAAAPGLTTADPATALLGAATLLTLRRVAGFRPERHPAGAHAGTVRAPAQTGDRLPPDAVRRLVDLCERADRDLLGQWLPAARATGRWLPATVLPRLFAVVGDAAELAPAALAVAGERGRWLAPAWCAAQPPRQVRALAQAVVALPGGAGLPGVTGPGDQGPLDPDDPTWRLAPLSVRREWLTAARRRDPAGARELLDAGWAAELPADRAVLLACLAVGRSLADEDFLQARLADRRADIRHQAGRLLAFLPGSRHAAWLRDQARAALRVDARRPGQLDVRPPVAGTADPPADRPGAGGPGRSARPPDPPGDRLQELIRSVPLGTWTELLAATPEEVLALRIPPDWRDVVRSAWVRAAVDQADRSWARALLATMRHGPVVERTALARLLPPAELEVHAAAALGRDDAVLNLCPAPWSPALSGAVMARLSRDAPGYPGRAALIRLAGRRLPPEAVDAVREAAAGSWPTDVRTAFDEAIHLLTYRHDMFEELQR